MNCKSYFPENFFSLKADWTNTCISSNVKSFCGISYRKDKFLGQNNKLKLELFFFLQNSCWENALTKSQKSSRKSKSMKFSKSYKTYGSSLYPTNSVRHCVKFRNFTYSSWYNSELCVLWHQQCKLIVHILYTRYVIYISAYRRSKIFIALKINFNCLHNEIQS